MWGGLRKINVGNFVILVYVVISFFSILLFQSGTFVNNTGSVWSGSIDFFPTLVYCFLITFTVRPFYAFHSEEIKYITKPNIRLFDTVSFFLIGVFLITFYFLKDQLVALNVSDFKEIRGTVYLEEEDLIDYTGIYYYLKVISNTFSAFWPISLLFFFYSIAFLKKGIVFNASLFIASFTAVVSGIAIAGRTQIVYWVLEYGLLFIFFKRFLNRKQIKRLKIASLVILSLIFIYVIAVTTSRWDEDANRSLLNYGGQSILNFNIFFKDYTNYKIVLERIFPFSSRFFFNSDFDLSNYKYEILSQTGFNIGIFYTFLGDLIVDLGFVGMLLFLCLFYVLTSRFLKRKKTQNLSFAQLFLLIMLINIPLQGVFYYPYWKLGNEVYIWGSIILYTAFKKKGESTVI